MEMINIDNEEAADYSKTTSNFMGDRWDVAALSSV